MKYASYVLLISDTTFVLWVYIYFACSQVKGAGIADTRENCWKFFVDRARKQLKVVLCFSPVGSILRIRSRKFPALISCTSIIWFHEWPQEALISVSLKFLTDVEVLPVSCV